MSELNDLGYELFSPEIVMTDTLKNMKLDKRKDAIVTKISSLNELSDFFYHPTFFDAYVITFNKPTEVDLLFNGYALNSDCEIFAYKLPKDFNNTLEFKSNWHNFNKKSDLIEALNKYIKQFHLEAEQLNRYNRIKRYSLSNNFMKLFNFFKKQDDQRINRYIIDTIKKGFNKYLEYSEDNKTREEVSYVLDLIKRLEELDDDYGNLDFDENQYNELNFLWYKIFRILSNIMIKIE